MQRSIYLSNRMATSAKRTEGVRMLGAAAMIGIRSGIGLMGIALQGRERVRRAWIGLASGARPEGSRKRTTQR